MKIMNIKQTRPGTWISVFLLALFLAGGWVTSAVALEVASKEDAIKKAFPGVDKIVRKKIWLTDSQRAAIGNICKQVVKDRRINFYVGYKGGQPTGYATLETVSNRSWPISYMVVLNPNGSVQDVEIIDYQGARNWGVQTESWLSQFNGKNSGSDFSAPTGITGATVSVRTVNQGVYKAVAAFKVLILAAGK